LCCFTKAASKKYEAANLWQQIRALEDWSNDAEKPALLCRCSSATSRDQQGAWKEETKLFLENISNSCDVRRSEQTKQAFIRAKRLQVFIGYNK